MHVDMCDSTMHHCGQLGTSLLLDLVGTSECSELGPPISISLGNMLPYEHFQSRGQP